MVLKFWIVKSNSSWDSYFMVDVSTLLVIQTKSECDMHDVVSEFSRFNRYGYEDWKSYLENFFHYFPLTSDIWEEQMFLY